jgi:hypothetical protein
MGPRKVWALWRREKSLDHLRYQTPAIQFVFCYYTDYAAPAPQFYHRTGWKYCITIIDSPRIESSLTRFSFSGEKPSRCYLPFAMSIEILDFCSPSIVLSSVINHLNFSH